MVLLEEFKDHKMFLIYDFLQHDVCSDTYPTFKIHIFFYPKLKYLIIIK